MREPYRMTMTTRIALAAVLATLAGPALAESAPQSGPMVLRVRPSGYDSERNEAQMRQERLLRRLEQSNHMVRSICVNCGDQWKHQIYAPFYPLAALNGTAKPAPEASAADQPSE